MSERVGQQLGNYRLVRLLERGGPRDAQRDISSSV
jgi:hypothetical protein